MLPGPEQEEDPESLIDWEIQFYPTPNQGYDALVTFWRAHFRAHGPLTLPSMQPGGGGLSRAELNAIACRPDCLEVVRERGREAAVDRLFEGCGLNHYTGAPAIPIDLDGLD